MGKFHTIADIREVMDKTYRLYLDGEITPRGFGDRYRPLEERVVQLSEEIPRLEAEADHLAVELVSKEDLSVHGLDFYSRWETLEPAEKRAIVETMVERITVGKDTITIDLVGVPHTPANRGTLATQPQGFIADGHRPSPADPMVRQSASRCDGPTTPRAEPPMPNAEPGLRNHTPCCNSTALCARIVVTAHREPRRERWPNFTTPCHTRS